MLDKAIENGEMSFMPSFSMARNKSLNRSRKLSVMGGEAGNNVAIFDGLCRTEVIVNKFRLQST
ncbi:MAG: hypothetical protein R2747_12595 [Pyrinomonadaceae bacterium]